MTVTEHPELVAALLSVVGVAAAAVEPAEDGPGTLRLQLETSADEVVVAGEVNRLLRSRFGLAVDADRVRVLDEPAVPATDDRAPADDGAPADDRGPTPDPDVAPDAHLRDAAASQQPDVAAREEQDAAAAPPESVEQSGAEPAAAAPLPEVTMARPGRLVIERVSLVSAGLGTAVSVTLGLDGRSYEGAAEGTATAGSLHRAVAGATLRAVEAVVAQKVRFDVEHVEITTTGTDRTALVVVTMLTDRATQRLSGASVVREDVRQAVIRSVLAAVNRRVEPMLGEVAG